ncbi:condensation domain-containing protein [Kitasatospora sp. NPDC005856]|uniref:condensation domain-containing protein n=1 Tax=Kitasatospora sp. NPDC005856 TaxID=3154566 RepID=UPI003404A6CF
MTNRQFASEPVTLLVPGAPAPGVPVPAPSSPVGRPPDIAARTRRNTERPGRVAEFVLVELHGTYPAETLRAALRTVTAEDSAGPAAELLWQRRVNGPEALDRVLADLGRSLVTGPRLRAVLVEHTGHDTSHGHPGDDRGRDPSSGWGNGPRLFVGIASGPLARAVGTLEELREALAHPPQPVTVPTSALQRELLHQVVGGAATDGRHVEQLSWTWHGPLDTARFTAAWQSVVDCETVLRTAFDWDEDDTDDPWMVLHEHAAPEVTRHRHDAADWEELLAADRRRGFDLRRPALLRATLVDAPPDAGEGPATRVLLTYHQAMLDGWSVRLLLRSFYRAYLAGGPLPGGERRPDLRDHARWLAGLGTEAARQFWSTRPAATAVLPLAPDPRRRGSGRARHRLTPYETVRLRGWAAAWGAGESSALQTAWALLLYRAAQADRPRHPARAVRVGFAVTVSGRGVPLDGIDRLPCALRNPLPISVRVQPGTTVPQLLAALRDGVLDLAAYEWVSPGQAHRWTPGARGQRPNSLVVLEHQPATQHHPRLESDLAAQGIRVESPVPAGTLTSYPITLCAHYDATGGLVLTTTHDRALLSDRDAAELLDQSAHLLRSFPDLPSGLGATEVLRTALAGQPAPRPGEPADAGTQHREPAAPAVRLDMLCRAARPGAGWVLLLPPPGAPDTRYPGITHGWPGPQALGVLRPAGDAPAAAAYRPVLGPLLESRAPIALVAPPGLGLTAYEIARLGAPAHPPPVVLLDEGGDLAAVAGLLGERPRRR